MVDLTEKEIDLLTRIFILETAKSTKDREKILSLASIYFKLTKRHLFMDFESSLEDVAKKYSL